MKNCRIHLLINLFGKLLIKLQILKEKNVIITIVLYEQNCQTSVIINYSQTRYLQHSFYV